MTELELRAAIVAEALSFEGTAFHDLGRVKIKRDATGRVIDRGGVDCAEMPYLVYSNLGLIPEFPPTKHSAQWLLHQSEEIYLKKVLEFAHEIEGPPKPGDLALWKWARVWAHGAIVIDWPQIIHPLKDEGMVFRDLGHAGRLAGKPVRFFSIFPRT